VVKTRFPVPPQITRVRFLAKIPPLGAGPTVLDGGVPWKGAPVGPHVLRVAGGEGSKRWKELERILAWLASRSADRSSALTVVGGGATLDLGALAASLYRRGMPLTLVPTTLLSMVDATLGGKTAVDLELDGRLLKNFAGTFHPAKEIWIAPAFLATLSLEERVSGAGEVYKTLWIRGGRWNEKPLLEFVSKGKVGPGLLGIIKKCLETKARLVERDPLDQLRVRELLNFGHTAGHALESAGAGAHGECILWGMAIESRLAGASGMEAECRRVISALGLRQKWGSSDWEKLLGADKKARGGKIEISVLRAPGKALKKRVTAAEVARAIREFL
jgi:3-dehydroquinate synthase